MDTYSSNHGKKQETDTEFAYPVNETSGATPLENRPTSTGTGFGFALLKALRMAQAQAVASSGPAATDIEQGAQFAGFVSDIPYTEPAPVYHGQYKNTSPLYFNTEPVDNANDTRLERSKLTGYSRAQLFFLLRLERFLRLRMYWLEASPRSDETWKTELVMRSIFSAYQDCTKHEVAADASQLLGRWNCC